MISKLRVPYTFVTPEDWPAGISGHPLGVWVADQRCYYAAGTLEPERVAELEALGMVWSVQDTAWAEGLAVARSYATAHDGVLLPPATAVWEGYPIGTWAKNQRAAARKTFHNAERRAADETDIPHAGELPQSRLEALEASTRDGAPSAGTSPGNAPSASPTHTSRPAQPCRPPQARSSSKAKTWAHGSRHSGTAGTSSCPPSNGSSKARSGWNRRARNIAAARQFHAREGHLRVPRQHVETVDGEPVGLGQFVNNARRRAATLSAQRRADLDELGMRW
ncbi:helicase associated domain-containing protein [Streptomyces sp. NPDC004065]|uniref:helicase associated domain-containing protein n=1 Tax=Streptomyces sp. NPDC004065 TaxID=3364689 RepID=UPI00384F2293